MKQVQQDMCPIWDTTAQTFRESGVSWLIDSRRAGGKYSIDIITLNQNKFEGILAAKLATWIIDENRAGVEWPVITPAVVAMVDARPALRFSERVDRFFLYLSQIRHRPGQAIHLSSIATLEYVLAWTESSSHEEWKAFRDLLMAMGLLDEDFPFEAKLTPTGFERLESVESQQVASKQGFVAMWFGTEMLGGYDEGFSPAIGDAGYSPFRIDRKEHANKIDDEIIAEIRRSRFVVADFTCPLIAGTDGRTLPNVRGGVYYEAGFARGLGIPVIWTVRADCIDHVHFDTRQFAHIVWNDPADLRTKLDNRIRAVIGQGVAGQ